MIITYKDEAGATRTYKDTKRWHWLLMPALSIVPFLFMYMYIAQGEHLIWTVAYVIWLYGAIPLIDAVWGEDLHNPPEEAVPALSEDIYYRAVIWATIPMIYAYYFVGMWFVMAHDLPLWSQIIMIFSMGMAAGNANTLAHELGHKQNKLDQFMARLALIAIGNGHFVAEHNRHHHVKVSTPEDCSSSRMGETLYQFAWRDLLGAAKGAWALEATRLQKKGHGVWSVHNELLQNGAATLLLAFGVCLWLGFAVVPFILLFSFSATFTLTLANYIEHYGLLRQKLDNGRYEPCQPHHSWNTNHIFTNLLLVHLQRHSDHHANPMRPYQALRNLENLPRLPSGYAGCFGLAFFPPLWFKVMDPKVMAWADGDLSKVNVAPQSRARLERKYGTID